MHETTRALPAERESAVMARALLRRVDRAALATSLFGVPARATLARGWDGAPYASLVLVAVDLDASPLLFLSDLAQHSRNIAADPRLALLFDGTIGLDDPLAGARLSVLGKAEPSTDRRLLARYAARHPKSRLYAGFGDFRLYRVAVERAHLVAGFGRIEWIAGSALLYPGDHAALAAAEPEILAHINADHAEALDLLAGGRLAQAGMGCQPRAAQAGSPRDRRSHGVPSRGDPHWRMTGIDPEGIDLRRGGEVARLDFPDPAPNAAAARRALLALFAEMCGGSTPQGNL
jgi:putative heme iron utilization protein